MRNILISYVQALNKQLDRSGPLFTGRFQSIHIDKEEYIAHLCRYIHLNPVKAGLVHLPENWQYSNYLAWIGERNGKLIDNKFVHEHFSSPKMYRKFIYGYAFDHKNLKKIQQYYIDD